MKTIEIVSRKYGNHTALVDDEDYSKVSKYKWHIWKGRNTFYAHAHIYENGIKRKTFSMHRLIMDFPESFIDHKQGNGLNNQKENLRLCSHAENMRNMMKRPESKLKYKGILFHKRDKLYQARIGFEGRRIGLGFFKTQEDAALAYNKAALKYFGEFAKINQLPCAESQAQ